MLLRRAFSIAAALISLSSATALAQPRGGIGVTSSPEDSLLPSVHQYIAPFYPYRPGPATSLRHRDIEFQWDALFDTYTGAGLSRTDKLTLDKFGEVLAEPTAAHNAFGVPVSGLRLVYDYFRTSSQPYDANPTHLIGFVTGDSLSYPTCSPTPCGLSVTPSADRAHADAYLYLPGHDGKFDYGQEGAYWATTKEDSSTGSWTDATHYSIWEANDLTMPGPPDTSMAARTDTLGTGWAKADGDGDSFFLHEFQHLLTQPGGYIDEIFATGAVAIGTVAHSDAPFRFDTPYTWGLLQTDNYQNWNLFSAYLAYNFRGTNTSATLDGLRDDLFYRWAHSGRSLDGLRRRLANDSCSTCSLKVYFNPGGSALDNNSRFDLLLHNWRAATYVDDDTLAEGQYGYASQFSYHPKSVVGAWANWDGDSTDDKVAIPPEVVARSTWVTRETTMVGTRYPSAAKRGLSSYGYQMKLTRLGAEYWVVRADPTILDSTQDLQIGVAAENIYKARGSIADTCVAVDGRLMASVIAYSVPNGSLATGRLWDHPEWPKHAFPPIWVDVDQPAASIDLVVPGFGKTYNAAVVVISFGDGPSGGLATTLISDGSQQVLPYRVTMALRKAPYQTTNPQLLVGEYPVAGTEASPTWSPVGDEVAFLRCNDTCIPYVARKKLDGSAATALVPGGTTNARDPDWSPRGDWVGFAQLVSGTNQVFMYNVQTTTLRQLTNGQGGRYPAFRPDGQRLAYVADTSGAQELRVIDLEGNNLTILVHRGSGGTILQPRWSPDGAWLYYLVNDSLYAIASGGGNPVPRVGILGKVKAFDLPPGSGPVAIEQTGSYPYTDCTFQSGLTTPFNRLATRDTSLNDTQARFYTANGEFYDPRWSPEGTRIAYTAKQSASSQNRDLFIGQTSFNHAPQFPAGIADGLAYTHTPFGMLLTATDADNEALTYSAPSAFRPSGSTFSGASFAWSNPGPVCAEYFVVFRASDGSGGVASRVVKITTVIDTVGDLAANLVFDNQVTFTWTAPGDGGTLGRGVEYDLRYAQTPLTEANWGIGTHVSGLSAPAAHGSSESKTVTGLTAATTYYFAIKTKDAKGNWSLRSNLVQVTTTDGGAGGTERAYEVTSAAHSRRSVGTSTLQHGGVGADVVLSVEMGLVGDAPTWTVRKLGAEETAALGSIDTTRVLIQAPDGDGGWLTRARVGDSEAAWRYAVRAMHSPGRMVFIGPFGVRQVWDATRIDGRSGAVQVATAQASSRGDLLGTFDSTGTSRPGTSAEDTLTLSYQVLTDPPENTQDWFLLIGPVGSEVSTPTHSKRISGEGSPQLPTAFRLRQNQPNPFFGVTTIRFDLPIESDVRLEIFDAQGRRLRTLANGHFAAGFHALDWDLRTASGHALGAGVYLYRIQASSFVDQKKMVLLGR